MKTHVLKPAGLLFVLFLLPFFRVGAQETYTYPLIQDIKGQPAAAPDLIQIPNNNSLTGHFTERNVPTTTCGQTGIARGYFFEDDAGLQFNNPAGFIDQAYSIAFNFQVDEFINPPSWVRILSFTHTDDVGIYIKLTNPPTNGTLEFWPYGTVGTDDFFTTVNFYQIILVRDDTGHIQIYVNGDKFADYDDSQTQKYVPQSPSNYIIWFRDDPSVLANEASPGFVSDIRISNYAWTSAKVTEVWEKFCSSLLGINEHTGNDFRIYPNPVTDKLFVEIPEGFSTCSVSIYDLAGQLILNKEEYIANTCFDVRYLGAGVYIMQIKNSNSVKNYRLIKR